MKIVFALIIFLVSAQFASAWFRYYDGESAAFVFIDERRMAELSDGGAVLGIAVRPPATWMGHIGSKQIEVAGFPIHFLARIAEIQEPAFLVFYSDRDTLTDKKSEMPDTVMIGGAISYRVGILTATKLFSLSGDEITLQNDVAERIKAYRNVMNEEDPKMRESYFKLWGIDWSPEEEN